VIRTAIASLAVGAALATGAAVVPASPSLAAAEQTACQRVWDALPADLQDDIRAAVSLPPRPQHRAMLAIRYGALHGTYGDQVQRWAQRLRERRVETFRSFPDRLRADIRAARALPFHAQRRAMKAIFVAAIHGSYGADVQELAERRKEFYEGCSGVAQSSAAGTGDPLAG
jgi:hypothetical protein